MSQSHPHRELFEPHPYLAGRLKRNAVLSDGVTTITTTGQHTRWTGAPANDDNLRRIVVVGGSTAFGTGVADRDSWPALLQSELGQQYAVHNYGVPGYSTTETVIQLALLVPERRPHIVIAFQGWSDLRNYHDPNLSPDYYEHGISQYLHLTISVNPEDGPFLQKAGEISAIFRMTNKASGWVFGRKPKFDVTGLAVHSEPDPRVDAIYRRNLKTIVVLTREMNARLLLVPQVLNEADFMGKTGSRWFTPRIQDQAVPEMMARLNAIMTDIATDAPGQVTMISQVLAQDWQPGDFVDDGHFTRQGGEKFVRIIAEAVAASEVND